MAVILVRANEGVLPLMDCETVIERVIPEALDSGSHMAPKDNNAVADNSIFEVDAHMKKENSGDVYDSGEDIMVLRDAFQLNAVDKGRNRALEALEEERRIMYVALTRAKKFLLITHVMLHGQQPMSPSRFLADIPKGLMHRTTWYDSNINESKSRTPKQDFDVKDQKSFDSNRASCGVSPSSNAPLKYQASSKDVQQSRFQPDTKNKIRKKRQLQSCKSASKGADDVEQSLKDIDALLNGMTEQTNHIKTRTFSCKDLKGSHKVETCKVQKRQSYQQRRMLEDSSDDSDFQVQATRNPKSERHE